MRYQDGDTENITELYSDYGNNFARQIPDGHIIVGLYGTTRDFNYDEDVRRITSLGFILMDISALKN